MANKKQKLIYFSEVALILALVLTIVFLVRSSRISDTQITELKREKDSLLLNVEVRNTRIANLESLRTFHIELIETLRDSLRRDKAHYEVIIYKKEIALENALKTPPGVIYENLQKTYPDSANKPYRFSEKQIMGIYLTHIEEAYQEIEIKSLHSRIDRQERLIASQDSIIHADSLIITNHKLNNVDQNKVIDNFEQHVDILEKQVERRKIWIVSTITASVIAIVAIL